MSSACPTKRRCHHRLLLHDKQQQQQQQSAKCAHRRRQETLDNDTTRRANSALARTTLPASHSARTSRPSRGCGTPKRSAPTRPFCVHAKRSTLNRHHFRWKTDTQPTPPPPPPPPHLALRRVLRLERCPVDVRQHSHDRLRAHAAGSRREGDAPCRCDHSQAAAHPRRGSRHRSCCCCCFFFRFCVTSSNPPSTLYSDSSQGTIVTALANRKKCACALCASLPLSSPALRSGTHHPKRRRSKRWVPLLQPSTESRRHTLTCIHFVRRKAQSETICSSASRCPIIPI